MIESHTINVLEFPKVRTLVASYALSSLGAERIAALVPSDRIEDIRRDLQFTGEFLRLLSFDDPIPMRGIKDIRSVLDRCARMGAQLAPSDFLNVKDTLEVIRNLRTYFDPRGEKYPLLSSRVRLLEPHPELEEQIDRVVDPNGEVRDTASPKLAQFRRQMGQQREALRNELERILRRLPDTVVQDRLITLREGRYVIPIREGQRSKVDGIVHDQSASGATVFIEPLATLERNNAIRQLEIAERREVERILTELTARITAIRDDFVQSLHVLAELDALYAKAAYGADFNATIPAVNEAGSTLLRTARHPLLAHRARKENEAIQEVVPLDISLGDSFDLLLITGPNAGGKTVALKTVGLLTLMVQAGLPIPADEKSEIAIYRQIYADIGDEQSIENDLSTFSSHARQLAHVCTHADQQTLVLLDEVGSSTDPEEGSALAMAVLETLTEKGAHTIATTHHGKLKVFVHHHDRMENGSMEFDRSTLRPTFRFRLGIPGSSYAFEIAQRLDMPQTVIDRALSYDAQRGVPLERLISDMEEARRTYEEKVADLEQTLRKTKRLEVEHEEKLRGVREEAQSLRQNALREARQILKEANALVERTVAEIRSHGADRRSIKAAREALAKARIQTETRIKALSRPKQREHPIQIGDTVQLRDIGGEGIVTGPPDRSGRVPVQMGPVKLTISLSELIPVRQRERENRLSRTPVSSMRIVPAVSPEIDLRGMTFDEASPVIDKYLDDAYLAHLERVSIIHGKGTGALREKVGSFLKRHPRVRSQRLGEWNEGGSGVTIVELNRE